MSGSVRAGSWSPWAATSTKGRCAGSALAAALSLCGCAVDELAACDPVRTTPEDLPALFLDTCRGALSLGDAAAPDGWLPAAPAERPAIAWAWDAVDVAMSQGRFTFTGPFGPWEGAVQGQRTESGGWVGWGPDGEAGPSATLDFAPGPEGSVALSLRVDGGPSRVSIAFGCRPGERWFGLGARPDGTDHTGKDALLYASEPGIGQSSYPLDEFDLLRGRIGDSYFPVPWIVSDEGVGLGLGGTSIVDFGICGESEPGVLRVEAWDDALDLYLWPGGSARETVAAWTRAPGPPAPAPPWTFGPWIAVQRGTDELLRVADLLRDEGIPAAAMWAQDWIGGRAQAFGGYDLYYHWTWDEETDPLLPEAIDTLHNDGFAFLGYFNPFVTQGFTEWDEALAGSFLIEGPDGAPYEFRIVDREGSMVDLFDPAAFDWTLGYMLRATDMGIDGWMCDFAEWLPFDAQVGAGLTGQDLHNAYPLLWQEVNLLALEQGLGVGQGLCFNRSGWAGTAQRAAVTWGGDQETGWGRDDGFPTAREIGVGLGLSGVGRYGSDIAGFTSVWDDPSTKELYWRWIELGTFEPVMRTHDGLAEGENWSWERDAESVAFFRDHARWHMRLSPLWWALDAQYQSEGLPILRHSILVEPRESPAFDALRDAPDQHFVGDDLLHAPVVEEGVGRRMVVVPPGRWFHLWDGEVIDGGTDGTTVDVEAPLGRTPIFQREGTAIPLLPATVMTTFPTDDPAVVDHEDVGGDLDWILCHGGNAASVRTLADGSRWTLESTGAFDVDAEVRVDGVVLAACTGDSDALCVVERGPARVMLRASWSEGSAVIEAGGLRFSAEAARAGQGTFEIRG